MIRPSCCRTVLRGLAPFLVLLPTTILANADYERALVQTDDMTAALQSYEVKGNLQMENNVKGRSGGMQLEAVFDAAARWPDRLVNSQSSTMFNLHYGTGPEQAWFYLSQTGAAFRGKPAPLTRDVAGAGKMELAPETVYNFYGGLGKLLLENDLTVGSETGSETLTVNGAPVVCQVFQVAADTNTTAGDITQGPRTFWFDPASGLCLRSIITVYGRQKSVDMEQKMTYTVTDFALNGDVPEERFAAVIPASARVVDSFERLTNPDAMTGQTAPDLTLTDLEGKQFQLSDYRGKVVFLDFWATWCGPCRMEMPHIETLHKELGESGDVVFLAASNEDKAKITKWLAKNPYTFRVAMVSPDDARSKYNVKSIPAGFVIDREGIIKAHLVGAQPEAGLRAALAKAGVGD